jgi:DNA processing protein
MRETHDEERASFLAPLDERPALSGKRHTKASWSAIAAEVVLRGSAIAVWEKLHPPTLDGIDAGSALPRARGMLTAWQTADFHLVTILDPEYPLALREIYQLPPVLFVKGQLGADEVGVSVIGSRNASDRG